MCDSLMKEIEHVFFNLPKDVKAVIITGNGGDFCAGLDLSEHVERDAVEGLHHSRYWHKVFGQIRLGGVPVIAAMSGSVIGGGLELACACHVRIAESSVVFQLPEGVRGIFVGGGASVHVAKIIGADRMTEMMLTGRKYNAEEGLMLGLTHYAVGEGEALELADKLAQKIIKNAPLSNYMMIYALANISDMPTAAGLFTESLCASISQTSEDAKEGLNAFLEKRKPEFGKKLKN